MFRLRRAPKLHRVPRPSDTPPVSDAPLQLSEPQNLWMRVQASSNAVFDVA